MLIEGEISKHCDELNGLYGHVTHSQVCQVGIPSKLKDSEKERTDMSSNKISLSKFRL